MSQVIHALVCPLYPTDSSFMFTPLKQSGCLALLITCRGIFTVPVAFEPAFMLTLSLLAFLPLADCLEEAARKLRPVSLQLNTWSRLNWCVANKALNDEMNSSPAAGSAESFSPCSERLRIPCPLQNLHYHPVLPEKLESSPCIILYSCLAFHSGSVQKSACPPSAFV